MADQQDFISTTEELKELSTGHGLQCANGGVCNLQICRLGASRVHLFDYLL